jgi:NAD+ diphosphatase
MPQPELPEAAHPDLDSMLSRKFGKEVANYFSGVLFALFICFQ